MRALLLLSVALTGGAAGFFAGGFGYEYYHPHKRPPTLPSRVTRLRGLQDAHRDVGHALDHHQARQDWIIKGTLAGAGTGFLSTLLFSRTLGKRKLRNEI